MISSVFLIVATTRSSAKSWLSVSHERARNSESDYKVSLQADHQQARGVYAQQWHAPGCAIQTANVRMHPKVSRQVLRQALEPRHQPSFGNHSMLGYAANKARRHASQPEEVSNARLVFLHPSTYESGHAPRGTPAQEECPAPVRRMSDQPTTLHGGRQRTRTGSGAML